MWRRGADSPPSTWLAVLQPMVATVQVGVLRGSATASGAQRVAGRTTGHGWVRVRRVRRDIRQSGPERCGSVAQPRVNCESALLASFSISYYPNAALDSTGGRPTWKSCTALATRRAPTLISRAWSRCSRRSSTPNPRTTSDCIRWKRGEGVQRGGDIRVMPGVLCPPHDRVRQNPPRFSAVLDSVATGATAAGRGRARSS